jgi:hypothetical protein
VADYLDSFESSSHWNSSSIRATQDCELESLDSFLNLLNSSKTHMDEVDSMLWTLGSNHSFDVKSYYKTLQTEEPCSFPRKGHNFSIN